MTFTNSGDNYKNLTKQETCLSKCQLLSAVVSSLCSYVTWYYLYWYSSTLLFFSVLHPKIAISHAKGLDRIGDSYFELQFRMLVNIIRKAVQLPKKYQLWLEILLADLYFGGSLQDKWWNRSLGSFCSIEVFFVNIRIK